MPFGQEQNNTSGSFLGRLRDNSIQSDLLSGRDAEDATKNNQAPTSFISRVNGSAAPVGVPDPTEPTAPQMSMLDIMKDWKNSPINVGAQAYSAVRGYPATIEKAEDDYLINAMDMWDNIKDKAAHGEDPRESVEKRYIRGISIRRDPEGMIVSPFDSVDEAAKKLGVEKQIEELRKYYDSNEDGKSSIKAPYAVELFDREAVKKGREAAARVQEMYPIKDPNRTSTQIVTGLSQAIKYLGVSYTTGGAGVAALAGVESYMGSIYEARELGMSGKEAESFARARALGHAAINVVPIERLKSISKIAGPEVNRVVGSWMSRNGANFIRAGVEGIVGGISEVMEQVYDNFLASDVFAYDPERDIFEDITNPGAVGFTTQALLAFAGISLKRHIEDQVVDPAKAKKDAIDRYKAASAETDKLINITEERKISAMPETLVATENDPGTVPMEAQTAFLARRNALGDTAKLQQSSGEAKQDKSFSKSLKNEIRSQTTLDSKSTPLDRATAASNAIVNLESGMKKQSDANYKRVSDAGGVVIPQKVFDGAIQDFKDTVREKMVLDLPEAPKELQNAVNDAIKVITGTTSGIDSSGMEAPRKPIDLAGIKKVRDNFNNLRSDPKLRAVAGALREKFDGYLERGSKIIDMANNGNPEALNAYNDASKFYKDFADKFRQNKSDSFVAKVLDNPTDAEALSGLIGIGEKSINMKADKWLNELKQFGTGEGTPYHYAQGALVKRLENIMVKKFDKTKTNGTFDYQGFVEQYNDIMGGSNRTVLEHHMPPEGIKMLEDFKTFAEAAARAEKQKSGDITSMEFDAIEEYLAKDNNVSGWGQAMLSMKLFIARKMSTFLLKSRHFGPSKDQLAEVSQSPTKNVPNPTKTVVLYNRLTNQEKAIEKAIGELEGSVKATDRLESKQKELNKQKSAFKG